MKFPKRMLFSRRTLMKSSIALTVAFGPFPGRGQDVQARTIFLLLDGLGPQIPHEVISQALDAFISRGIPICVSIAPFTDGSTADPSEAVRLRLFAETAQREPGLVELAPVFEAADERSRYFQLRQASDLRRKLALSALGDVSPDEVARIATLINRGPKSATDRYAFRSEGFRISINTEPAAAPGQGSGSTIDTSDWGILQISGMTRVPILSEPDAAIQALSGAPGDQLLSLSFDGLDASHATEVLAACKSWAERLLDALFKGALFITRPADFLLQGNPGASKYIGLLLDVRAGETEGMTAFMKDLGTAGFPFSLLVHGDSAAPAGSDLCVDGVGDVVPGAGPACILAAGDTPVKGFETAEIVVLPPGTANAWSGLRSDARFQIGLPAHGDQSFALRQNADPMTDQVEVILPAQVETDIQRRAYLAELVNFRRDGRGHFYSVPGFMKQIVAPDPKLDRLWSWRRRKLSDPSGDPTPDPVEAERLRDDAKLAWRFIEKYSDADTGICVGTASVSVTNDGLTMWDLASQLFGILSAMRLGIIMDVEARQRVDLILDHLPGAKMGGARLPPAAFQKHSLRPALPGFDACDTGRFLIALDALRGAGLFSTDGAQKVLAGWDLSAAIRNRHVFGYDGSKWYDDTETHCTPYTGYGYAAWGMQIDTAYPELGPEDPGDGRMRLLDKAAFLGAYGTEPLLLEAVERTQSAQSRYLSDILFDAQLSWFEQTGKLKCVSEAALNFEPWFIYQGLRVDRDGEASWVIKTKSQSARYDTAGFRKKAALISSKSAYLWAAAYPHAYSQRLVDLVRAKARIEGHGFSVGIFEETLEPMKSYSDLNTNGVILTAIARMLAG